jgi:D-alanyl-D-alanine carboxypeptidase (penicillin-binding protein 5/6)
MRIRYIFNGKGPAHLSFLLLQLFILFIFASPSSTYASDILARAAICIDRSSGEVLFGKNPDLKLPPASTTKLVTAMTALDMLNPDDMVTISRKASETPSIIPRLRAGKKFSVRELLTLALMRSINGAAVALAEAAAGSEASFVPFMNKKVLDLGAADTKFINASGLPGKGQYTTARDLSKIMKTALTYHVISGIIDTKETEMDVNGKSVLLTNTNNLLWSDTGHLGGKTGYTRAARHCFVGASDKEDGTLIIALLGNTSRSTLWGDAVKLLAQDFEKGRIIIDATKKNFSVKRKKAVHRSKARRPRTKSS